MEPKSVFSPSRFVPACLSGASWLVLKEHTTEASTTLCTRRKLNEIQCDAKNAQRKIEQILRTNWAAHKNVVSRIAALMCVSQVSHTYASFPAIRLESPASTDAFASFSGPSEANTLRPCIGQETRDTT